MAKGDYILVTETPFQSVVSHPRRYGVMFNPSASRSRLRIMDSGRRYEVRLTGEGTVQYSINGGNTWRSIDPLQDPCSKTPMPAFVSYDEKRAGQALAPVRFDMIAVGRGRIIGKEVGTDRIFHLVMDEIFKTHKVTGDCNLDVLDPARTEDPAVPGFYMKLDPEFFTHGTPSVVVPLAARRHYGEHPASWRLPVFAQLLEMGSSDVMLVLQRARTWYLVDARAPLMIVGPEDLRFTEEDIKAVFTKPVIQDILETAKKQADKLAKDDLLAQALLAPLGLLIDPLAGIIGTSIEQDGYGALVFPGYIGLGLALWGARVSNAVKSEMGGKFLLNPAVLRQSLPVIPPLNDAMAQVMLRSRRRAATKPADAKKDVRHVAVAPLPDHRLELWATDATGGLFSTWKVSTNPNSKWVEWSYFLDEVGGLPARAIDVAVAPLSDGRLLLWATDEAGGLSSTWKLTPHPKAGWSPWVDFRAEVGNLPGKVTKVAVAPLNDSRLEVWVVDNSGQLFTTWQISTNPNSNWAPWSDFLAEVGNLPGKVMQVAVGPLPDGRLELWAVNEAGGVFTTWKVTTSPNSSWAPWVDFLAEVGALPANVRQVSVAPLPDRRLEFWAVDQAGHLFTTWKVSTDPNAGWAPWTDFVAEAGGLDVKVMQTAVAPLSDGRLELWATDDSGRLFSTWKVTTAPNADWAPWVDFLSEVGNLPEWAFGMPTSDQPPSWMPTYLHNRFIVDTSTVFNNWEQWDNNAASVGIVADGSALYQLHNNGRIFRYVGPPLTGWEELDNNPATKQIAAAGGNLYQIHNSGAIWKYVGPPLTGWQQLDNNPASASITADGGSLYQLHNNGRIFRYVGPPLTGWQELDNNPATKQIAAAGGNLYQMHNTGAIWKYVGPPLTGWQQLDNNPASASIVADSGALYQLHNNGGIFRYVGPPLTGWEELDNNSATEQITAAGGKLYQRHNTGAVWRYIGPPLTGWEMLDNNSSSRSIAAGEGNLYQMLEDGSIWKFAPVPGAEPGDDVKRFSIQFSKVLDIGVGYSHWSEQWQKHFGGEIQSLLATRPLFQQERYNLIQYRFLNGPVIDGDAFNDGTCNFYMLVKLGPTGSDGAGLRQRYAILWMDEQAYFTQRWRLLHPTDDVLGDLFSLMHSLRDNPEWHNFSLDHYWSPFEDDLVDDNSRMAVRRQIVALSGFNRVANRHEIYTICFNFGVSDHSWRWRLFPSGEQVLIDNAIAQDRDLQLPAITMNGPANSYVVVNTIDVREDTMLHVRGTMRLSPDMPLRAGRWLQRYLPADCRHVPAAHQLKGGKPAIGFNHAWDFVSETAYRRADQFYHFGVYEERTDSRCQYYEVDLLPGADGQTPRLEDVVGSIWSNDRSVASEGRLRTNTTSFVWSLPKENGAIVKRLTPLPGEELSPELLIHERRKMPTMSLYEETTRFRLLERKPLGLIAVFYDKRDDELQSASHLPQETVLREDFEDARIPSNWKVEEGEKPEPPPDRSPREIRILVKSNRRVMQPPVVRKALVVRDKAPGLRALNISLWTPLTEQEVSENIWKVSLAAIDETGVVPIFNLTRFPNFVRRAMPDAPLPFDFTGDLGDVWRYDCVWTFDKSMDDRINRFCTHKGHIEFGTSLWFEDVVGHRSLAQEIAFS